MIDTTDKLVEVMAEAARSAPLTGQGADEYMKRQIYFALRVAQREGVEMVLSNPSEEMLARGAEFTALFKGIPDIGARDDALDIYRAMLKGNPLRLED